MKAQVGDELIIESPEPGTSGRSGTIVALQNADGSPPYVVHWLAGDYDSLIEPGPTAESDDAALHDRHQEFNCRTLGKCHPVARLQAGMSGSGTVRRD
jgi:Domain of unknown function (DUF1918)